MRTLNTDEIQSIAGAKQLIDASQAVYTAGAGTILGAFYSAIAKESPMYPMAVGAGLGALFSALYDLTK